jgi:hypothetical protein
LFCLLQLGGLGWEGYWKNSWNKFDLLLLVSSIVDMIVALVMGEWAPADSQLQQPSLLTLLYMLHPTRSVNPNQEPTKGSKGHCMEHVWQG